MKNTDCNPFKSPESKEKFLRVYDEEAKAWPVESESKMINTSYGNTYVRINGSVDAPPLVLLHGMNSNSLMWLPNIKDLSKNYRTYAIDDIYGNGRSIGTKTINDSNDLNNWLDELFDALKLGDGINLVGMSYGGWQASQYALNFPNKINKLVLLAPAATVIKTNPMFTIRAILSLIPIRYFLKI
ncbi:MAG: alpha/beta hydrolase [Methanobacterium sp. ERen5]|nr:MAG: alpha/beta hydrolase [Methanobacterium sp. ERen5]